VNGDPAAGLPRAAADAGGHIDGRVDARVYVLVALLALAAAGPSLLNGFAYDDQWIIVTNPRVHDLHHWADWFRTSYWPTSEASLYRPLASTAFALQWIAGHGTPLVFHIVNVVLAVAGAVAFLWLASLMLPPAAATVVAALFAVHPVHVEATGNVVGQSELAAGLIMLIATAMYIRARRDAMLTPGARLGIAALYLAGMFFKENAIVLPAWLLAAEATVLRNDAPLGDAIRARWRALVPFNALLACVALLAVAIRWKVIGAIGGDISHPALDNLHAPQRALVMLGVLPDALRLLVWPAKLFADYSPMHVTISASPNVSQINGILVLLGMAVLLVVAWRKNATAAFGLSIAAIAWLPTANIVFPSGVLLAERALYLPSAGMLLAAGTAVAWGMRRFSGATSAAPVALAALGVVLVAGTVRSVDRQRTWRSSEDVFLTMRRDEPTSFRAHYAWGGLLFERGDLVNGEREWRMAIRIMPGYHKIYEDLASRYLQAHLCVAAVPMYRKAIELAGTLPLSRAGIVACELETSQFRAARHEARLGMIDGNDPRWFRARLFSAESALVALDSIRK